MRLDKSLASVTDLSRKQARNQIRQAMVRVDDQVFTDPSTHICPHNRIELAGKLLRQAGFRYFMLNKPSGVICATKDADHVTIIDLLTEDNTEGLQIAGRLDKDTTGLVLLTDDGQWNHSLTSPRHECPKSYELTALRPIEDEIITRFALGVVLPPENRRTRPAQLTIHDRHSARLILHEGRYHQVKRMFEATGNRVLTLHRSAVGQIILDDNLPTGGYRALTNQEIHSI
jgi:16S rRNA pseudouridine516 synthase